MPLAPGPRLFPQRGGRFWSSVEAPNSRVKPGLHFFGALPFIGIRGAEGRRPFGFGFSTAKMSGAFLPAA